MSFGSYLRTYVGDSSLGREAARHWRKALESDYLKAAHYRNREDVRRRLAQMGRLHSKVYTGLDLVWLSYTRNHKPLPNL